MVFDSSDGFMSGETYGWQITAIEGTRTTSSTSSFVFCEPIIPAIISISYGKFFFFFKIFIIFIYLFISINFDD